MSTLNELKQNLKNAKDAYLAKANTAAASEVRDAHLAVKAAQAALGAKLAEGAKPCPRCAMPVHGMEHSGGKRSTYTVGCIGCPPQFKAADGTIREFRVQGGLMPQHSVDAWNAGPEYWAQSTMDPTSKEAENLEEFSPSEAWMLEGATS